MPGVYPLLTVVVVVFRSSCEDTCDRLRPSGLDEVPDESPRLGSISVTQSAWNG